MLLLTTVFNATDFYKHDQCDKFDSCVWQALALQQGPADLSGILQLMQQNQLQIQQFLEVTITPGIHQRVQSDSCRVAARPPARQGQEETEKGRSS